MTMRANIEAMRALMYDNAAALDLGRDTDPTTRAASGRGARRLADPDLKGVGHRPRGRADLARVQVHGGMGFVEETGAAQHYRDARIAPIYEGTNGIQAIDLVLRKLPMAGGAVVAGYLDEMAALDAEFEGHDDLASVRINLDDGVALLREATEWLARSRGPERSACRCHALSADVRHRRRRLLPGEVGAGCHQLLNNGGAVIDSSRPRW